MTLIKGRYRIIETIARGGFGETFLTVDEDVPSKRKCVVKQLKPLLGPATDDTKERFKQEAEVLEKLGNEHDQIPKLHAYFEEAGEFYLVQEFIPGKTVRQLIREKAICDEEKVRRFLLDLLPVLDFVHKRKIIHRDIKPDNIIIRESDGKPILIDFGLVKQVVNSEVFSRTDQVGTMGFIAMEQVNGGPVYASDIFSVGMTAIAMLTPGFQLKPDSQTGEVYWKNLVKGGLSGELGEILDKATELRVRDRFRTASEMLEALTGERKPAPVIEVVESLPEKITNVFGMEFVLIRPGKFWMGSTDEEVREAFQNNKKYNSNAQLEWYTREQPKHEVEITKPFWVGKYQVTQKQWRDAVAGLRKVDLDLNAAPSNFKGDDLPVERVSWNDCSEMIKRLNASGEGFVYDLPTEAEWEYACRAGTTTPYWFGETITPDDVNYNGQYPFGTASPGLHRGKTIPVGSLKKPNAWGLHDMHGNVLEWCRDWFGQEYYQDAPSQDPEGPKQGEYKVLRGGSWDSSAVNCRSAVRYRYVPDYRDSGVGFRCVIRSART
jgi:eukaryotic-like serine/threonine-protein kinase